MLNVLLYFLFHLRSEWSEFKANKRKKKSKRGNSVFRMQNFVLHIKIADTGKVMSTKKEKKDKYVEKE